MVKVNDRSSKEMIVITKAKDLMKHCFVMTANTNRFPKRYRFSICSRIENLSVDIYQNLIRANECNISDDAQKRTREELQTNAIVSCKLLNGLIDLAYSLPATNLQPNSVAYWGELVVEVKRMTVAWRRSECHADPKDRPQ